MNDHQRETSDDMVAAALKGWFDLTEKVILVTGAGSGLGESIALACSAAGATVACADLDDQAALSTAAQCGPLSYGIQCDVRMRESVESLTVEVLKRSGHIDVLFNNAGINGPAVRLHEVNDDEWDDAIAVDLGGVFLCARSVITSMLQTSTKGKIVNTASVWGTRGVTLRPMPAYAAAKGTVINLTKELALEYAHDGITVNALAPLAFRTNIGGGATFQDPSIRASFEARIALKRTAHPNEIQGLAVYLASSSSDFMTGAILTIDGGFSAS